MPTTYFFAPSDTSSQETNVGASGLAVSTSDEVVLAAGAVISSSGGPDPATGTGGFGIDGSNAGSVLMTLAGSVYSTHRTAIQIANGGNTISMGPSSTIYGKHNAIDIAQGGNSIENSGWVVGGNEAITASGASNTIVNAGTISGVSGISLGSIGSGANQVDNSGTILGGDIGVILFGDGSVLSNSGRIQTSSAGDGEAAIKLFTEQFTTISLSNSGTIAGPQTAISGNIGKEVIINTGTIKGNIELDDGDDYYDGTLGILRGVLYLGAGDDRAYGGAANEIFNGDAGNDFMDGGAGNDTFNFSSGNDTAFGGAGDDLFSQNGGTLLNLTLDGGEGSDRLLLQHAPNVPAGTNLDVSIDLRLTGSQKVGDYWGSAQLSGIEKITSGDGNDLLIGSGEANVFAAGAGSDTLEGGLGDDVLDGGKGFDFVRFAGSAGAKANLTTGLAEAAGYGSDALIGIEGLIGGSGADSFTGDGNDNTLVGNAGDDTLNGGLQNDTLDGGTGIDTAVFSGAAGAEVSLAIISGQETGYGKDTLKNIENLTGGAGADKFTGSKVANVLIGNAGKDTLAGGLGNDKLTGGTQADAFVFNTALSAKTNMDTITDFKRVDDTIQLENAIFRKLTKTGVLNKGHLAIGTRAKDADDYIVYDKAKGALYYDADGSGSGAAVKFAQLNKGTVLASDDFLVI